MAVSRACCPSPGNHRHRARIQRDACSVGRLPNLELGIGISYQEAAPLYLMDGNRRIHDFRRGQRERSPLVMTTSVSERPCKLWRVHSTSLPFRLSVIPMQAGNTEDFTLRFNVGGICMNEAAFHKLQQEVSISPCAVNLPLPWMKRAAVSLPASCLLGNDIFRKIAVRESRIAHIDLRTFTLQRWTERRYYEVCANPAISRGD